MKKLSILALAFMAAFALASCNRQEIDPPQGGVQGKYLLTEITAFTGDEDTKTNIQSNSVVVWNADDQIAVKGTDGALHYYKLKYGSGTPVGRFLPATGQTPVSYNSLSDLTAIYPACAAELSGGELYVNINNQDLSGSFTEKGLTTWTADSPFTFTNNDIKVAVPSGTTLDGNGKLNFKFKQLGTCCSFIIDFTQADQAPSLTLESVERIQITTLEGVALGGRAKVTGTSLGTITNPTTSIDWTPVTPRSMSGIIQPIFVFYPEATTNTTLKMTLTTTEHEFVFTGKPTQNFEAGRRLTFPVSVDKNFTQGGSQLAYTSTPRTDVDQFYYYGGTNCLLLASTHEVGYLDVTQYVTDSRWHNTKNSADVLNHKPAVYAKIIWSEGSDVIDNDMVDASNGYKLKLVGSDPGAADAISVDSNGKATLTIQRGGSSGNALVGIYDGSNNLLWSYHIWCPLHDPTSGMNVYTVTSTGPYTVMTMPIGAIKKAVAGMSNPQDAAGIYFQWGRKDPLGRPTNSNSDGGDVLAVKGPDQSTALNIGDSDNSITGGNLSACEIWFAKSGGNANENKLLNKANAAAATKTVGRYMIEYSVSKPWMFILCSGLQGDDWTQQDDWLWGNGKASHSYPVMEETYKSIFDPSPEGFRVAPQDLWFNFTKSHGNAEGSSYSGDALTTFLSTNCNILSATYAQANNANGWTFYINDWKSGATEFYYMSGSRVGSSGSLTNIGSFGYSSASSPFGTKGAYFGMHRRGVFPDAGGNRSQGYPVRCVQEP